MYHLTKPQLLIDADIFAYKIASACQENTIFGDGEVHRTVNIEEMKREWVSVIERLETTLKADTKIFAFSGDTKNNFRKKFLPTYKENRKTIEKPLGLKVLRDWIKETYPDKYKCVDDLEGDDIIGIFATNPNVDTSDFIIVSTDKDFMTIPNVTFYDPDKNLTQSSDPTVAYRFFLEQVLAGDRVDNYTGIPGIGPKKAANILDKAYLNGGDLWKTTVEAYENAGLTEEDALIQARCARILHYSDYDFTKKEVILWQPTGIQECTTECSKTKAH